MEIDENTNERIDDLEARLRAVEELLQAQSGAQVRAENTTNSHIMGLEMSDGRVVYCAQTVLTTGASTGSYFAARFGGEIPAGAERQDNHGRSIFHVGRDGELFQCYILPFLLDNDVDLPPFGENPVLWRRLRKEADFYRLEGLVEKLCVTHSCQPHADGRGILYWLGTGKGEHDYRNPFDLGAVHVGGWCDMSYSELIAAEGSIAPHVLEERYERDAYLARSTSSRQALVQYRPPVYGISADDIHARRGLSSRSFETGPFLVPLLRCRMAGHRCPVVVDLKSIQVHLTSYSLRFASCHGMTHWNLEASKDGTMWEVLHAARNDHHLVRPSTDEVNNCREFCNDYITQTRNENVAAETLSATVSDQLLAHVERFHRHNWDIDPDKTSFYRYFRLIGIGEELDEDSLICMHGVGLELYGDVYEE